MSDSDLSLPVVDAFDLDESRRSLLRPGELVEDRRGLARRLPRWFYEVESWKVARETSLTEHFTLHELMTVDVREPEPLRAWPRYVPCAVPLLAAHLELIRQAVGTLVWVSANGGYRSPAHGLTLGASVHCWGTAANVYRVGEDYLDSEERIGRIIEVAGRVAPTVRARPCDDHLHLDLGFVTLTPRGGHDRAAG